MFMYIFHLLILFYIFLSSMYRIQSSGRSSYTEDSDSDGRVVKQAGPVKEEKPIVEERKHKEKVPKEEPPRIRKSTEKLMHERDSDNPRVVQHATFNIENYLQVLHDGQNNVADFSRFTL